MTPLSFRFIRPRYFRLAALGWLVAHVASAQPVVLAPLHPTGLYAVGEKLGWELTAPGTGPTTVRYTLKKNGLTVLRQDTLDLSSGHATIETSLDEPGAVLLEITGDGGGRGGGRTLAGALVAPEKLQPSSPRPADFDAWWEAKIRELHAIPPKPQVTPGESGSATVDYALVQLDNINGTHVHGQLARPKTGDKFPALLVLQWAGVYPLQKSTVTRRAAQGWLALNIEPHDLPVDQPAAFYANEPSVKNYQAIGQEDREKSYFLRMYLSAYRALDYLAARPDWDGKTLVVMGTSMGGQQSIAMAGLHPQVTALLVMVPSSCDLTGPEHGRAAGFPDWARDARTKHNPQILETGRYFDPVNFAPHIRAAALVAMGFLDETSPPAGVWSALNLMTGPKEAVPMINSGHQDANGSQRPYQLRSEAWLAALVRGAAVPPAGPPPGP